MSQSAELAAVYPANVRLIDRPAPQVERVYTPKEAAEHLRVSERTVYTLIKKGALESFVPYSRNRRVTASQLARFIDRESGQ